HPADALNDRLDRAEHTLNAAPTKPVVADVDHAELLCIEIERYLQAGVIGMKEKRLDVRAQRTIRGLQNYVRNTVTNFQPLTTPPGVSMVDIPGDVVCVVVLPVAIDSHPPRARNMREQPSPRQQIPILQLGCELKDEDSGVYG